MSLPPIRPLDQKSSHRTAWATVAGSGTPDPAFKKGPRGSWAALPDPQQNRDYGLRIFVFFLPFQRIASTFNVQVQ